MAGPQTPPKLKDFEAKSIYLNSWFRDANKLVNAPAFSASLSAVTVPITTGTFTKIQCNTEEFDFTNAYDNATNFRFQPQVAGAYDIEGVVNGVRIASIYKNGTEFRRGTQLATAGTLGGAVVAALVYLNGTTDYVELYGWQDTGGTVTINGSNKFTYFSGVLVRPQ